MTYTRDDYQETFICTGCRRPVTIRVPAELRASEVIAAWQRNHGGKCKDCIEKEHHKKGAC